jgi:Tol biopolymer transport system component
MPLWTGVVAAFVVLGAATWWFLRGNRAPPAALQAVPLATYPGREFHPTLSPDGNQVAFSWNGEKGDNFDIYVKLIGPGRPLRLTTDPGLDTTPAWSPDGRSIAFVRWATSKAVVMQVAALGGPEREIAEFLSTSYSSGEFGELRWSPDGHWLLVSATDSSNKPAALFLVSIESGEKRQLTFPPASTPGDSYGNFSPDGRTIAFVRESGLGAGSLYTVSLASDLSAKGEPKRISSDMRVIRGIAWTADSREIVFSSGRAGNSGVMSLWRIAISGSGQPQPLGLGESGSYPSISRQGRRLVYSQFYLNTNIWRVNLSDPREKPAPIIVSTRSEDAPRYSPDGKKIAFESSREGNKELWVCDADGSNPVQLVSMGRSGAPGWSPDSRRIVFNSNVDGYWQIYTVSAHGGRPQRITSGSANNTRPSWSHDGKWIYFGSTRSGGEHRWQVWKAPAGGGEAVQVTKMGGYNPRDSLDGKTIYYAKDNVLRAPLWKVPADGGEETQVLDSVFQQNFEVARGGIHFTSESGIYYFNFATGAVKPILQSEKWLSRGLGISPDERWLLYSQADYERSELMLVDNFR